MSSLNRDSAPSGGMNHAIDGSKYTEEHSVDPGRLAILRQETYQLLGAMLLYPEEQLLAEASKAAKCLRSDSAWAVVMAFYNPWDRFLRDVERLTPAETPGLQGQYQFLFSSSNLRQPVPLCESGYLEQASLTSGQLMASLEAEYANAGVAVIPGQGESPDHAAVELEFTAFLCALETQAWEANDRSGVLEAITNQERFIQDHPVQWLPSLARAIASREDIGLYLTTALAAQAMVIHDVDFLKALSCLVDVEVD